MWIFTAGESVVMQNEVKMRAPKEMRKGKLAVQVVQQII